jgi:hypothetical protein
VVSEVRGSITKESPPSCRENLGSKRDLLAARATRQSGSSRWLEREVDENSAEQDPKGDDR